MTGASAVGIVVHGGRPEARRLAVAAAAQLRELGVAVVGCTGDGWEDGRPDRRLDDVELRETAGFGEGLDVVLSLGGDGTFLRAAWMARDGGVPLLGVDLGRLGFLTEVDPAALPQALGRLVEGDYTVEERMTLAVTVLDAEGRTVVRTWALNEASIERTVPQRLVVLEVKVGDTVFANVPADAFICATPTGSTAYAFSAGGPILSPRVNALVLVPVAPHSLFNRTLVVDPAEVLTLRAVAGDNACVVHCDGRGSVQVPDGGAVRVERGEVPVRLARLSPFDFAARVREKFGLR